MNQSKTEYTQISKKKNEWKTVRKLGNLIGDDEDILKRKQLATNAFNQLQNLWNQKHIINERKRIQLYEALIIPINCGTWGLSRKKP